MTYVLTLDLPYRSGFMWGFYKNVQAFRARKKLEVLSNLVIYIGVPYTLIKQHGIGTSNIWRCFSSWWCSSCYVSFECRGSTPGSLRLTVISSTPLAALPPDESKPICVQSQWSEIFYTPAKPHSVQTSARILPTERIRSPCESLLSG